MPNLSIRDVFALVTLMGLYLSEASGHQKAYKELLAYVDAGYALTLDVVQQVIIRYSRSKSNRVFAVRNGDMHCTQACPRCCSSARNHETCTHRCPRCCDTRGSTPRPSRSSSRDGSRSGSPTANKSALRGYVERMIDEKLASSNPAYPKHDQEALTARENIWRAHGMPEETQDFAGH